MSIPPCVFIQNNYILYENINGANIYVLLLHPHSGRGEDDRH